MSLSSALEVLANYRINNTRASQDIFDKGTVVLRAGGTVKLGHEGWEFLEQLALAAIDIGRLDIADASYGFSQCLKQLSDKFPNSPRVDVLTGIRMEATESPDVVLQYYSELLQADSVNAAIWKRRISVIRRMGRYQKAVEELSEFLDTFYTDVEGWLELADIYSFCNQYTSALQALSHALLLAPQNPFTALQFAETAYTAGDLPLALKTFLVVIDMGERDLPKDEPPTTINIRAWLGVKLCSRRLVLSQNSPSASQTPVPKTIKLIDELATERVLSSYRGQQDTSAKQMFNWMASS
ncbi:TPR-like protein [Tricholoma matsutake]|nr:TPR-like protein [Tricholoma matsutake 945]